MEHVAILNSKMAKIEDIISGKKTIESRWYKNKSAPWDKIKKGETIYFKKTGEGISAKAIVDKVLQLDHVDNNELEKYIDLYGGLGYINMKMTKPELLNWANDRVYIILIFLKDAKLITPFDINKYGFGNASAWLCVKNINEIKK